MPRPTVPLLLALLIGIGLLVFLVEHWVVTDREAIEAVVREAEQAVEDRMFPAFRAALAPDYSGEGGDRDGAAEQVEALAKRYEPSGLKTEVLGLQITGDAAASRVQVDVAVLGRLTRVLLDATYVRTSDGWRILSVTLVDGNVRRRRRGPHR